MAFLLLAYPELSNYDFDQIQNYRSTNDDLYDIVEPHFTIVFPVLDFSKAEFIREIKDKTSGFSSFVFTMSKAILHKDEINNHFSAFLVPDTGYIHIVNLHDKCYSEKLKVNLRPDLGYIPHIRIGNAKDQFSCRKMVDQWNAKELSISGTISSLTVVNYDNGVVTRMEEIELGSSE